MFSTAGFLVFVFFCFQRHSTAFFCFPTSFTGQLCTYPPVPVKRSRHPSRNFPLFFCPCPKWTEDEDTISLLKAVFPAHKGQNLSTKGVSKRVFPCFPQGVENPVRKSKLRLCKKKRESSTAFPWVFNLSELQNLHYGFGSVLFIHTVRHDPNLPVLGNGLG